MSIVSYDFAAFLLVLFLIYYIMPKQYQWVLLLGVSYLFYLSFGMKPVVFLLATTCSTYAAGRWIDRLAGSVSSYVALYHPDKAARKEYKKGIKKKQWNVLLLGLAFNFGMLAVLKYANFTIGSLNGLFQCFGSSVRLGYMSLLLPLGISYYTFQSMGYLIDVYRGKYRAEHNPARFALFVSFFPQLIQGPISRFDDLKESLFSEHDFEWKQISFGLQRILWGYFKKLVIADRISAAVLTVAQDMETYRGLYVLAGALCYTINLYADFTGGIDIAIGVAQVLGIRLKENFDHPFASGSLAEYWRRWHMTLMTWFREYVFYPASVCGPMKRLSKIGRTVLGEAAGKRIPVYCSSLLVWFITGIWHGASWNFIYWGLANCVVLLVSQECAPLYKRFHGSFSFSNTPVYKGFQCVRTLLLVSILQMFEYYPSGGTALSMMASLLTDTRLSQLRDGEKLLLGIAPSDFTVLCGGVLILFAVSILNRRESLRERLCFCPVVVRCAVLYLLFLAVLTFGVYGIGYDASQFIYNQF